MGLFTERDEETTNEIIIGKLNRIEAKLDAVINALHEYDNDGYGESSFEAFQDEELKKAVDKFKPLFDAFIETKLNRINKIER